MRVDLVRVGERGDGEFGKEAVVAAQAVGMEVKEGRGVGYEGAAGSS